VVKPQRGKLQAITHFSLPTTKKQVHSFLGLSGHHRCSIPNYATTAAPLTDLTQKLAPEYVSLGIKNIQSFWNGSSPELARC